METAALTKIIAIIIAILIIVTAFYIFKDQIFNTIFGSIT